MSTGKLKKCIIIDDEPAAHYVLVNYIRQDSRLELAGEFYNGIEALAFLRENEVDLLFMDIDMPEITGIELLKMLPNHPTTILTTAYSEFALESYDYGVLDYLLKPIYLPRFLKAVNRFFDASPVEEKQLEVTRIAIKVDGNQLELDLDDFLYAQSLGNYVRIFTAERNYVASMTTNELEKSLPAAGFMRIHKSFIVSLEKISEVEREHVLIGTTNIPVGITYKRELQERLRD